MEQSDFKFNLVAEFGSRRITSLEANPHHGLLAVALHDGSVCIVRPQVSKTSKARMSVIAKMQLPVTQLAWAHWSSGILLACLSAESPPVLLRPLNPSSLVNHSSDEQTGDEMGDEPAEGASSWLEETLSEGANCYAVAFSRQGLLACANANGTCSILEQARHEGSWHLRCTTSAQEQSRLVKPNKDAPPCVSVAWNDSGALLGQALESGLVQVFTFIGGGSVRLTSQELFSATVANPRQVSWAPSMARSFQLLAIVAPDSVTIFALQASQIPGTGKPDPSTTGMRAPGPISAPTAGVNTTMGSSPPAAQGARNVLNIIGKRAQAAKHEGGTITSFRWNPTGSGFSLAQEDGTITTYALRLSRPQGLSGALPSHRESSLGLTSANLNGGGGIGLSSSVPGGSFGGGSAPFGGAAPLGSSINNSQLRPNGSSPNPSAQIPGLQIELEEVESHGAPFFYNPVVRWIPSSASQGTNGPEYTQSQPVASHHVVSE